MDVFRGEIARNGCNLSQMEIKMGPEVLYCCWVLLSSPGVNNSLSTIFLGHPVGVSKKHFDIICVNIYNIYVAMLEMLQIFSQIMTQLYAVQEKP